MLRKPRILIPSATHPDLEGRIFANRAYVDAIERAGGITIFTGRPSLESDLDALIELADGFLLMGGSDVDPKEYNKNSCPHIKDPDRDRDTLELTLLSKAEQKNIPILGICRGLQLMNIWKNGDLYRDIADEFRGGAGHDRHDIADRSFIAHEISIAKNTLLASFVGVESAGVNSLHHQSIRALGTGLRAVAHSQDGLIEAIELENYPFGLGVQWHPEELRNELSVKIFSSFVRMAEKAT